jgi:hypothetical protein
MQTSLRRLRAVPLLAFVLLAGCALNQDPYEQPGTWHATGDNDYNLRLMVADPADLAHGHGAEGSRGQTSADAIGRLRDDKVKKLPDNTENFTVGGTNAAAPQ